MVDHANARAGRMALGARLSRWATAPISHDYLQLIGWGGIAMIISALVTPHHSQDAGAIMRAIALHLISAHGALHLFGKHASKLQGTLIMKSAHSHRTPTHFHLAVAGSLLLIIVSVLPVMESGVITS